MNKAMYWSFRIGFGKVGKLNTFTFILIFAAIVVDSVGCVDFKKACYVFGY